MGSYVNSRQRIPTAFRARESGSRNEVYYALYSKINLELKNITFNTERASLLNASLVDLEFLYIIFICGWKGSNLRSSDVVFPFYHTSLTVCDKSKLLYSVRLQEFLMKYRGHFSVNLSRQHFRTTVWGGCLFILWTFLLFLMYPPLLLPQHTHARLQAMALFWNACTRLSAPICNLLVHCTGADPVVRKFPGA